MSDIINILPDSVANQIAAGEVVDRPASAVKELLENALDAGATQIQLIVKDAGRTLIQVIDNGCGMSDSDARLCFERHATSKIHKADDLFAIRTMGFRGEALASIAAIAQVELKTRMHDNELGTCVLIEGCQIKEQSPCTTACGTSIAVKNLFFNVPARRNFLKKDSVEMSHIEEIFKRVALVNCDTAFLLYSNGKLLYDLKAGNLAQRITQVYGNSYKSRFLPVEEHSDIVNVKGFVSKAEHARKTRGEQYLFVNGRFIKHPMLSAAIERAYAEMIPDKHYPSYFLTMEVDPARIDVNIHPTKTEVKFVDEHAIFAILRAAAKKALGQFSLATELEFNPCLEVDAPPMPHGYVPPTPQVHFNPDYNPFNTSGSGSSATHNASRPAGNEARQDKWTSFFDLDSQPAKEEPAQAEAATLFAEPAQHQEPASASNGGTCIQLQNRYIVSAMPSGLMVIDQQAAHERILYDRLLGRRQAICAQQLLFPISCTFSSSDAEIFTELLPDLAQYGFEINALGHCAFVVTATPPDVKDTELQALFDQMLEEYKCAMMQKFNDRSQSLCRSLARQMSIRTGTILQQEEMQQIVADLFCCQTPAISPSGKRTMNIIPADNLLNIQQ